MGAGGGGLQVNKFEQVCSDQHQISLARGGEGALPCGLSHEAFNVTFRPTPLPVDRQTHAYENITAASFAGGKNTNPRAWATETGLRTVWILVDHDKKACD